MIQVCVRMSERKTYLTKLSEKLIYLGLPWVSVLLPRVTYDLSATPRGRSYDAVTQLREIPARKSSLLEVHPA